MEGCRSELLAEGMGFEPMSPLSQAKRLAGARTRPLCDPSLGYMVSNDPIPSNTCRSLAQLKEDATLVKNSKASLPPGRRIAYFDVSP